MSLSVLAEFWAITKDYVTDDDRKELVTSLVDLLIDHGHDLDDALYEFEKDREVSKAIKFAKDDLEDEEAEDSGYDEDEDDY